MDTLELYENEKLWEKKILLIKKKEKSSLRKIFAPYIKRNSPI